MLASLVRTSTTTIALLSKAEEAVPVVAERAGWSYAATGLVLDEQGRPLEKVEVRNLIEINGIEYNNGAKGRAFTDSDGRFKIPRVFPGSSIMRMELLSATKDVAISVDHTAETMADIDLGTLIGVGGPQTINGCHVRFSADFTWEGDQNMFLPDINVRSGAGTMSTDTFTSEWLDYPGAGMTETGEMTVVFSSSHDRILSFSAHQVDSMVEPMGETTIEGGELPVTDSSDGSWTFSVQGPTACDHVDRADFFLSSYMEVTGYDCDSSSYLKVECW